MVSLLLPVWAWGATYTVCSSGCDETSIQDAFANNDLVPGDIVYVYNGTYAETLAPNADDAGDITAQVTLEGESQSDVVIDATGEDYGLLLSSDRHYMTFKNLTFKNANLNGIKNNGADHIILDYVTCGYNTQSGCDLHNDCQYFTARNCIFSHNGTDGANNHDGILLNGATDFLVEYCIAEHNNSDEGSGFDASDGATSKVTGTFQYNISRFNDMTGFSCSGGDEQTDSEIVWQGNISHDNYRNFFAYGDDIDVYLYNNTIGDATGYSIRFGTSIITANVVVDMYNNLSYGTYNQCIYYWPGGTITSDYNGFKNGSVSFAFDDDNNIAKTWADWQTIAGEAHSLNNDNPLFVDASGGDFHLQDGSPCIDVGTDVGLTEDFDGVSIPRGSGYDIGAFEWLPHSQGFSAKGVKFE